MKKTVIIKFCGGLGNQMFQYCLLKRLEKDFNVLSDISEYSEHIMHYGFELDEVYNIRINRCSKDEKDKFSNSGSSIFKKIKRKVIGRKGCEIVEKEGEFCNEIFRMNLNNNYYLDGYWQDLRYFIDEDENIRRYFNFKAIDEKNKKIIEKMKTENSVSIHIRRGDYVNNSVYEGICTLEYYKKAIEYIKEKVDCPKFYIFSNDMLWVKENLKIETNKVTYVNWNDAENSYKDLQLMSNCKHNIIANSSFSWWGAFLNSNIDKNVISPLKWNNLVSKNEKNVILKQEWIKINSCGVIN